LAKESANKNPRTKIREKTQVWKSSIQRRRSELLSALLTKHSAVTFLTSPAMVTAAPNLKHTDKMRLHYWQMKGMEIIKEMD
jgi:hypothetical protein